MPLTTKLTKRCLKKVLNTYLFIVFNFEKKNPIDFGAKLTI